MLRVFCLVSVTSFLGCSGTDDGSDGSYDLPGLQDSGSAPGETGLEPEPEPVFQPDGGTWLVVESELTMDQCGLTDLVDRGTPGSTLELLSTDDLFSMKFEGGETVHCSAEDSQDFHCDPTETVDTTARDNNLKADIPVVIETYGVFSDSSSMWMESLVDIDCEGQDCALIEILLGTSFPCQMAMASDLVLQ